MFARLMHVKLKPENIATAQALWPPAVEKYKEEGLHAGYMLLLDAEQGTVLSVTIWESEEACRANEQGPGLKQALAPFRELFAEEPRNEYAVVAAAVE